MKLHRYLEICLRSCLVLSLLFLGACEDSSPLEEFTEDDAIVFGHFYGECLGEGCIEIYRLTQSGLSEDVRDFYPNAQEPYEGLFFALNQQQFEEAQVMWNSLPLKLLQSDAVVYGSPDAGDWGGIYLELDSGTSRRFWLIDQAEENLPDYLVPLRDQINEVIQAINQ